MKRLYIIYIVSLFALLNIGKAKAQYTVPAQAPKMSELEPLPSFRSTNRQKALVLGELKTDELRSVKGQDKASEFRVFRFAVNRSLELDLARLGEWSQDKEGHYVWTFSITSPKAISSSLLFEDYELEDDAKLFVYGANVRHQALTSLNNSASQTLQLAPIRGEKVRLIYVAPLGDKSQILPFKTTRFSHGFRSLDNLKDRERYGSADGEPWFNINHITLSKLACADNVVKHKAEDLQARSVVLLITDGDTMSSASLINNTKHDGTPYLLTASHCVNRLFAYPNDLERVKKTVRTAVVFFGFESPIPNGNIRGSEEKSISGAELVAYNIGADMALLKLTGLPKDTEGKAFIPPAYNPYFAGWNISSQPKGAFFNIHHPTATTKRFNLSEDKTLELLPTYTVNGFSFLNTHWHVKEWTIGTTAGGSSGSPLFDKQGRIIGALTGGVSNCGDAYNDKFFAIRKTWQGTDPKKALSPWLDPENTLAQTCEGYDPNKDKKVYRLSEFYGKNKELQAYEGEKNTLTRIIDIKGEGEIEVLGAYYVFKGNKDLQLNFPKHLLELRPIKDNKIGKAIWSNEINTPSYHYYKQKSASFNTNARTILTDTIEVFQPSTSVKVQAGQYVLSLRRDELGQPIKLPLLTHDEEAWLDLVVQSEQAVTTPSSPTPQISNLAYYSKGKLYVYMNNLCVYQHKIPSLKIYDISGNLHYQHKQFELGQNVLDLSHLPRQKMYIAVFYLKCEKKAIKLHHLKFYHK